LHQGIYPPSFSLKKVLFQLSEFDISHSLSYLCMKNLQTLRY
jgi:hypothetical protein